MKTQKEVLNKHPWWHKIFEHIQSVKDDHEAKDPDTGMPAVIETTVHECWYDGCKYRKTVKKIWCDY